MITERQTLAEYASLCADDALAHDILASPEGGPSPATRPRVG